MSNSSRALHAAIKQACHTLLWSETDNDGNSLDDRFDKLSEADYTAYCQVVQAVTAAFMKFQSLAESDPEQFGHDFVLTINGHGAGFWDGDWDSYSQSTIDALCAYCETVGPINILVD